MRNKLILLVLAIIFAGFSISIGQNMKAKSNEKTIYLINRSKYGYEHNAIVNGAKSAAKEYGVDLHVLAPDFEKDVNTQKLLLEEAISSQADGILIYPIDALEIVNELNDLKNTNTKILLINDNTGLESGFDYVGVNYKEIGEEIAASIGDDVKNINIYRSRDSSIKYHNIIKTLENALGDDVNINMYLDMSSESQIYSGIIKKHVEKGFDMAICLDEKSLLGLANCRDILGDIRVVGINNSMEIIKNIDNGNIDEVYVANHFSYGYVGILELINKEKINNKSDTYYKINKENIFDENIEKIIFPLVQS